MASDSIQAAAHMHPKIKCKGKWSIKNNSNDKKLSARKSAHKCRE